jgi:TRAP-type C4-dicarboxylate transport system substrate-binding protein
MHSFNAACVRFGTLISLGLSLLAPLTAQAQNKAPLKVIGSIKSLTLYSEHEIPFWTKTLAEKSKGAIRAEIKSINELNIPMTESVSLISKGDFDMGAVMISTLGARDAALEAADLAGTTGDLKTARRVVEAAKPMYDQIFREQHSARLLAFGVYPAQVLFCRDAITSVTSLNGKKVRTATKSLEDLMRALGAQPVNLGFSEVYNALKNKTIDCAVSGSLSGNTGRWYEVTSHLFALPLNWGPVAYVANNAAWAKLGATERNLIEAELKTFEQNIWALAEFQTIQGYACNAGSAECRLGTPGKMKVVYPSLSDRNSVKAAVQRDVVPQWAKRTNENKVLAFNAGIGKVLGVEASK